MLDKVKKMVLIGCSVVVEGIETCRSYNAAQVLDICDGFSSNLLEIPSDGVVNVKRIVLTQDEAVPRSPTCRVGLSAWR